MLSLGALTRARYGARACVLEAASSGPLASQFSCRFCSTQLFFLSLPEFVTVVKWRVLCALGEDGSNARFTLAEPMPRLGSDVVGGNSGRNHPTSRRHTIHIGRMALVR